MAGHQNHAVNAAAWAAMRAAEAEERAAYLERRRAEKAARRAANRAAWWGRMGREVPEPETAPEPVAVPEPEPVAVATLSGFRVNEPDAGFGDVTTLSKDGLQYSIVREGGAFTVCLPNYEELQAPTYEAAEELVAMAHDVALEEAEALPRFERGRAFSIGEGSYTVEGVSERVRRHARERGAHCGRVPVHGRRGRHRQVRRRETKAARGAQAPSLGPVVQSKGKDRETL